MASVKFTRENPPPIDAVLDALGDAAIKAEKPIRCRIQPDLYDYEKINYMTWAGLTWTVDLASTAEGRLLREGLADFFKLFGESEKKQARVLKELRIMAGRG